MFVNIVYMLNNGLCREMIFEVNLVCYGHVPNMLLYRSYDLKMANESRPVDFLVDAFPGLAGIDPDSPRIKYLFISGAFLVGLVLFVLTWIFSLPLKTFRSLRPKEKVFWSATVVRGMYGFWTTTFALLYLILDDNLLKDIVLEHDITSHLLAFINLGFFLFEFCCLMISSIAFRFFDLALFLHHTLGLGMFFFIMYYDIGHFFGILGGILEMSTPFSCICWLMLKLNLGHTRLWSINQMILIHVFHCRSMVELWSFYLTWKYYDSLRKHLPIGLALVTYVGLFASFFYLTPLWTYKKTKQYFTRTDWNHPDSQPNGDTVGKKDSGGTLKSEKKPQRKKKKTKND